MSEYPDYDEDDYYEHGPFCDCFECSIEDELADCSMFPEQGQWFCAQAGSEHCDWHCPFSKDIGKPLSADEKQTP